MRRRHLLVFGLCCVLATAKGHSKGRIAFPEGQGHHPHENDPAKVHLPQGVIIGEERSAGVGKRPFYAFQGIPFAQPPVGQLRFKDPEPAGAWTEARNGSFVPPECPQPNLEAFFTQGEMKMDGEEDCLYLNVYTPQPHVISKLAVMVWIHGGSFSYGNATFYQPLPLLTKDIVLVTLQYRLDTLGFLSTEDSVMPGNLALKDQTLALRWIQHNIHLLGGDPNRVTLFGESAGAAAVHHQMMTPYAQGLFHRAILQSGAALCPWALIGGHKEAALKLGQHFNCPEADDLTSLDSRKLLACLQQIPVEEMTFASFIVFTEWHFAPSVMKPRVDYDYIPDHPAALIQRGQYNMVDIISGNNQDEGTDYALDILSKPQSVEGLKDNFAKAGPIALRFFDYDYNPEYLAGRAFFRYLNDVQLKEDNALQFMELLGDRLYTVCQEETSLWHASQSREDGSLPNVFHYTLRHRGQQSYADQYNTTLTQDRVTHADDLQYLFESSVYPFEPLQRPDDVFVSDIMVNLWTNFAATGNPTPPHSLGFRWTPMSPYGMESLAIQTLPLMELDNNCQIREFWKNIATLQNKILYPLISTVGVCEWDLSIPSQSTVQEPLVLDG